PDCLEVRVSAGRPERLESHDAFAFPDDYQSIGGYSREPIDLSLRPAHGYVSHCFPAESEMATEVAAGNMVPAAAHFVDLLPSSGRYADASSDRVAAGSSQSLHEQRI